MPKTEEVQNEQPSAKREITATVIATAVGLTLGLGANILITKVSKKVHDQIAPEYNNEEN